uniref:Uncharacterized protein n=1 Tax=Arundo donax TaxID=35708 RepID=A0A0A8YQF8_ARUDO
MASSIKEYHLEDLFHKWGADIGLSENTGFPPVSSCFLLVLVFAKGESLDLVTISCHR